MGTRGLFGFYYKKKYYFVYNHFDSYPKGLGNKLIKEIIDMIKNNEMEKWIEMLINIKVVFETDKSEDWYYKLHENQGSFKKTLESGYLLTDDSYKNKYTNDIFIEYSYVLDFDHKIFRFFNNKGYQTKVKLNLQIETEWKDEIELFYDLIEDTC